MRKSKLPRGKYINPRLAEWVMGLAQDWTCKSRTAMAPQSKPDGSTPRLRGASLFSGVAGLDLGTEAAIETSVYVEKDEAARAVLMRRMDDEQISRGEILPDVEILKSADLNNVEVITAGFPCPDIAISGHKAGLSGSRSSLYKDVIKAAVMSKCRVLCLENVANILAVDMRHVFLEVVIWMLMVGFTGVRWGIVAAADVGPPQLRKRWFCVAWRTAEDKERMKDLLPAMSSEYLKGLAKKPWNNDNTVDMKEWLLHGLDPMDRQRLKQLGNAVVPQCASVAYTYLAHA